MSQRRPMMDPTCSESASSNFRFRSAVPELKDFVLTERLGSGTYATVYKAFKKGLGREVVAVKCIERRRLTKVSMENLITEIKVMRDLDHKHIVKLKDFEGLVDFIREKVEKEHWTHAKTSAHLQQAYPGVRGFSVRSLERFCSAMGIHKKARLREQELDEAVVGAIAKWCDTHIFLIMEYCSGGDLSSFIHSRRSLRESSARKFLRQLALALQFLRSKGIAHMDLKPQNLLLTGDRKPILKVADFGMAQHMSADDRAESFRGSPLYMAPEVILGEQYDAKVDLWSVGVILYEALFGMAPFASKTFEELQDKILDPRQIELPANSEVSEQCRDLLLKLLQRDPQMRISFEDFFNHPFIDLEHMPRADSLQLAKALVMQAVVKDSEGKVGSAVNYYCQALEYFMPALEYEEDPATKEALHQKIEQYMERAETLKELLRTRRPSLRQKPSPLRLLDRMQAENPKLKAALTKARIAEELDSHGDYQQALELYEDAIAILISLSDETPTYEQKRLIKSEVQVYLDRAEEVSMLMKKSPSKLNRSTSWNDTETSDSRCKMQ